LGLNQGVWDLQSWNSPGWGWRLLLCIALALFLLHAVVLTAAESKSATSLLSNLIQFAFGLLAAVSAAYASQQINRFGKHFWLLISAGFFVWSAGQLMVTYYDSIRHIPLQEPWPSDVVFFLSMAPAFMALFIDTERGLEWKNWPRILDLAQVVILTVAAYLLMFSSPAHWKMGGGTLARLAWLPDSLRDTVLASAFTLRAIMSRQKLARNLYGRMAIFFVLYLSGEIPYLYLQSTKNLPSGTLWDLGWTLPFLAITILAATSRPDVEIVAMGNEPRTKKEDLGQWGLIHIVPMIFPLVVLLMAAGIAEKQLAVATIMVVASFACSSARIIFSEKQRRQSDIALEEKNGLVKSVFEGTGDAVYIKDLEGRYVIVNPAFARYFEKPVEQIVGKTAAQLFDFATARRLSETDRLVIETGRAQTFEYELPLVNGTRAFLVMKSPYQDGEGKTIGVIVVSRDITEYRAMEERLRQSQKMEAIGTLAGGVAHDFNNLLMVIAGYGSVLNEALAGEPKLRGHVEQIQKASERAASLTRQLLAFSRKQTIQPVPLNLNTAVSSVEKLLRRLIGENIAIVTHLGAELGSVRADAGQIEQVLLNLAVNARDAMPDGGKLTLETRHREIGAGRNGQADAIKPGSYVELSVSDTGIGMDDRIQTHVFEPYFTTKPSGKGTGLGLSTVYGIVQQAGGYISFSSKPREGTTFRILLPRIDSLQAPGSASDFPDASYSGEETVLLAEDEPAVCDLVRAILSSRGYTVLSARLPQEAERIAETHQGKIDLLLTDVIMPGMSGAELSKRIARRIPGIKLLFMSGYIDDSVVRQGIGENETAFLQKPFTPVSLAKKVREVLDGAAVR
jgi:two-component system cell cycle sensor histidine kinase/response regulator CckA